MRKEVLAKIFEIIKRGEISEQLFNDCAGAVFAVGKDDWEYADGIAKQIYKEIAGKMRSANAQEKKLIHNLQKQLLLFEAPVKFDSYLRYVEWERDVERRFYPFRRKALKPVVDALQDLADDKLDLLTVSMPPGVGKSATAIFFLTWLAGRNPEQSIIGASHSSSFMRGVYDECLRILSPDGEYLWNDVFPGKGIVSTNAQNLLIDLDRPKRFTTLEFTSIGAGNAGKIRAQQLLYCDDLIDGIETALNIERLNKLYEQYKTDLTQRKIGNCKELHLATRWSVHDVIGRLQVQYGDNERCRFIALPALNENDQSNFDYQGAAGFSTEFYHNQRNILDDLTWKALYMNEPIEREGLLYNEEELQRYFDLPQGEPDSIIAVCDTKDRGSDYCVMPIAYQYGDKFYIEDVICDNSLPEVLDPKMVNMLYKHKVKLCQFESNSAGGRVAEKVRNDLKAKGGNTAITTKFTTANKETKIIVNSPYAKEHFYFKDKSLYTPKSDYGEFIRQLCTYTVAGKNKHDDTPDAVSMLAEFVQNQHLNTVEIIKRVF